MKNRKFQSERPSSTDRFGGKGHAHVANAVAKVILNNNGQHVVGIEGPLGSGKSTVIELLRKIVEPKDCHVVTFDADQYHSTLKPAMIKTIQRELGALVNGDDKSKKTIEKAAEKALGKRFEYTKKTG